MSVQEPRPHSKVQELDGRLHLVHYVTDEHGNRVPMVLGPLKVEFRLTDIAQLVAGAFVMGLPVATTGEVWDLGEQLSMGRTLLILLVSILSLGAFIWGLFYGKHVKTHTGAFLKRVTSAYLVTFAVSFFLLWLFDKAPLDNPAVAFTRTVLVAFPASFAATAVDFMK
jgi:uncharacterized membrane protein